MTLRLVTLPALICSIAFATPAAVPAAGEFPNVPGRANATPSIAAAGSFVAVAWGASAAGKADVFVAVSRDGGTTFGPAVHVNTVPGEARLNGEMPPRVVLGSSSGSSLPEIAVLWTARGAATEIKVARSRNGGRMFEKAVSLQAPGTAGDRGWPSLAFDSAGQLHAIWLDHRNLAAARAAGGGAGGHKPGAKHDGVAMAQNSSLYHASLTGSSATEREITKGVCYCCKTALAAGNGRRTIQGSAKRCGIALEAVRATRQRHAFLWGVNDGANYAAAPPSLRNVYALKTKRSFSCPWKTKSMRGSGISPKRSGPSAKISISSAGPASPFLGLELTRSPAPSANPQAASTNARSSSRERCLSPAPEFSSSKSTTTSGDYSPSH
jgi:hypothetical protein